MDIGSLIIGGILTAICLVPFLVMHLRHKQVEVKWLSRLNAYAHAAGCQVEEYEFCGNYLIGIDRKTGVVFFSKRVNAEEQHESVRLSDIEFCKVEKVSRVVHLAKSDTTLITRMHLLCKGTKGNADRRLTLYSEDERPSIAGELESAEKWSAKINTALQSIR